MDTLPHIIGMDFGTTNTGAATYDGAEINLLPLDPANSTPSISRTSIYITRSRDYYLGSAALSLYFNQNVGRPTRYRKIKVGEIIQVFAELPTFYRDVYVYEDEFSPGRLFLSIKTALRNPNYYGTVFLENWYSATDLVAIFLLGMKMRMDAALGRPATELVLGRPVHFSTDPNEDKIAQSRLLEAAFKAGFEKIYFEYEPVAAALSYERTVKRPEVILVFDFGGGTLDFTVMEIGPTSGGAARRRRVLATGGIPIAGDIFDQRLFRVTIPKHLGENDTFVSGGKRYPVPAHIFDLLSSPQEVLSLNTPENLEMLRSIHLGSQHKSRTEALLQVASSNYALLLFDLVEQAKRRLSTKNEAVISFEAEKFGLREQVSRARFEMAIRHEYEAIRDELINTLDRSGLRPAQIDRVIRTGGSSQIPLFVDLLNDIFGPEKVQQIDVFSSVTSGLAIRGYEIAKGLSSLPGYEPGSGGAEEISPKGEHNPDVAEINLGMVRQRLEVGRDYRESKANLPQAMLVLFGDGGVSVLPVEDRSALFAPPTGSNKAVRQLGAPEAFSGCRRALLANLNEQVLFITDAYKLVTVPAQALFVAGQMAGNGLRDLLRLEAGESAAAGVAWQPEALAGQSIYLVSAYGQARAFDAVLLAEQVTHKPYFHLERRYTGRPVRLVLCENNALLAGGTSTGRVGRTLPGKEVRVLVWDMLRVRSGEEVTAAAPFQAGEQLFAISEAGSLLALDPLSIPVEGPPASHGQALRRSFHVVDFISQARAAQHGLFALTLGGPLALSAPSGLTPESAKPFRLQPGERLLNLLLD